MINFSHFRDLETIWGNIENPSNFQQIFSIHVFFSEKFDMVLFNFQP